MELEGGFGERDLPEKLAKRRELKKDGAGAAEADRQG